jgi:hypothetical protein
MNQFPVLKIRSNSNGTHSIELDGVDISQACEVADLTIAGFGPAEVYLKFAVFLDVEVAAAIRRERSTRVREAS